ncbi:MAG: hypothetical protein EOO92_19140 [Pedobacter sp.]|nr:MAG: hypothetical protein EOO92_19140 [Pedobacter sp.]
MPEASTQIPIGDLKLKIKPAPALKVKTVRKKNSILPVRELNSQHQDTPVNLQKYINNYNGDRNHSFKEGLLYISFEVDEDKKTGNYKITKSDNFEWQDDFLSYLNKFNETVSLPKGTYQFYSGFVYAGNEDKYPSVSELLAGKTRMLFGGYIKQMPTFVARDETKEASGKIVNYLTETPLIDPVILIDGKEATYKKTKIGLKFDEVIYPRELKTIRVFNGDRAVAQHNESARKGLVVITTKDPQ